MKKCYRCKEELPLKMFYKNKNRKDGHDNRCKVCAKETVKKWREDNPERQAKRYREWVDNNREASREHWNKSGEKRRKDPIFRLARNQSSRVWKALKSKKSNHTAEYLGCDIQALKNHLEEQFQDGMSWDNYGEWHVDHIQPLASANTIEEVIPLLHYTNLQPLWAKDNLSKGARYEGNEGNNQKVKGKVLYNTITLEHLPKSQR